MFYVRQRDKAAEWKCQPEKWLSRELEINEIILGSISLLATGGMSAVLACYISNGGYSSIYYKFDEYGWLWFFLQWPCIFIYQVRYSPAEIIAGQFWGVAEVMGETLSWRTHQTPFNMTLLFPPVTVSEKVPFQNIYAQNFCQQVGPKLLCIVFQC